MNETRKHKPCVRMSDNELQEIQTQAVVAGMTLSNYMRQRIFGHTVTAVVVPAVNRECYAELVKLRTELVRQGVNLNQLTKVINSGSAPQNIGSEIRNLESVCKKLIVNITTTQELLTK